MALAAKRSQIRKIVRAPSRHRTDVVDLVSVSQLSATELAPPVGPSAYLLLLQGCQSLTLRGSRTGPGRSPNSLRRRRLGVCGVRDEPVPKAKNARSQIRSGTCDPSAHKHANENEQQKHKEREHFSFQECWAASRCPELQDDNRPTRDAAGRAKHGLVQAVPASAAEQQRSQAPPSRIHRRGMSQLLPPSKLRPSPCARPEGGSGSKHALTMTCTDCERTTRNPDNCGFASRAAATLARQACL